MSTPEELLRSAGGKVLDAAREAAGDILRALVSDMNPSPAELEEIIGPIVLQLLAMAIQIHATA